MQKSSRTYSTYRRPLKSLHTIEDLSMALGLQKIYQHRIPIDSLLHIQGLRSIENLQEVFATWKASKASYINRRPVEGICCISITEVLITKESLQIVSSLQKTKIHSLYRKCVFFVKKKTSCRLSHDRRPLESHSSIENLQISFSPQKPYKISFLYGRPPEFHISIEDLQNILSLQKTRGLPTIEYFLKVYLLQKNF